MKFGVVPNFYDRDVGRLLPLKHLLLETDAPYFVPMKLRDTENAPKIAVPGHVFHTAAQIAALRDLPVEDILLSNRRNVAEIYGVPFEDVKEELECNKDTSSQEEKKVIPSISASEKITRLGIRMALASLGLYTGYRILKNLT
jgi:hypothetical protein